MASSDSSMIPTIEVIQYTTPKASPGSGGTPSAAASDGNEPGWVIVPTKSWAVGSKTGNVDDGGPDPPATMKWGYGAGTGNMASFVPLFLLQNCVFFVLTMKTVIRM